MHQNSEAIECVLVVNVNTISRPCVLNVSSKVIIINKKPVRTETETVQMLMNTSSKKISIYLVQIADTKHQSVF